jgi:putative integral membrane protein (TIGR02587 family)
MLEEPAMTRPLSESVEEYGRGVAGGFLFSLPLLYTMEVWWHGFLATPLKLLAYLGFTFVLLLGYNRFAGMRQDAGWLDVVIDSVEEMGIGVLLSALILYLIGQIDAGSTPGELIGKIAIETGMVAVGVSVGTAQLGGGNGEEKEDQGTKQQSGMRNDDKLRHASGADIFIGFCGAFLISAHVAPTEEVVMIAAEASSGKLVALALLSLVTAGIVLFFSNFRGSARYSEVESRWKLAGIAATTYAIAAVASALMLWFFDRFDGVGLTFAVSQIVVLAFPAVIGASAGRLLLREE